MRESYRDWYGRLRRGLPADGPWIELSSGPGFARHFIPELILTNVVQAPWHDRCLSADALPFDDGSVGALVLFDVLHHLAAPATFFAEAVWARKVKAFRDGRLSPEDYAAKRGIRVLTLKRWLRILGGKGKAVEGQGAPSFLPVRIVAPSERPSGQTSFQVEVDLTNGRRVRARMGAGSDVKSVARLLDALDGDVPC